MSQRLVWHDVIGAEKQQDYFQQTLNFVESERALGKTVFPPAKDVFSAFRSTEFGDVKVVILGQDPHHVTKHGLGFFCSVLPGIKPPPSLVNMYKELSQDIEGFEIPTHGYLQSWAEQGVLLLNTVLTVEQGKAHSHAKTGWETFTDRVIESINRHQSGVVFLLWGSHAQKKGRFVDRERHYVLSAPHPSPLSAHRGFFGCQHFSQTNQILQSLGKSSIDWRLPAVVETQV
ncbi:uracil-DNA glycosylase [Vibrio sp.]|uniref:uracil-DNA glycosylase n=1 Tax=Vibrio sp. TaxID=678 RepID=UPI00311E923D